MTPPDGDQGVRLPRTHVDHTGAGPRLVGGHCTRCDVTAYPTPAQCPECLGPFLPRPLSGTGSLYSYSVIHIGARHGSAPYTVGYVDLPEGARVFAHVSETDEEHLRPDMTVRLLVRDIDEHECAAVWVPETAARGEKRYA